MFFFLLFYYLLNFFSYPVFLILFLAIFFSFFRHFLLFFLDMRLFFFYTFFGIFFCVYNLHNLNYQSAYFFILHFLVNFPSQYAVVCAIACCCCVHCRDNESHFMFFKLILSPRSSNYCRQSILRPQRSVRLIRGICNFWKLYINWLHSFGTWPTTTSFPLLLT